MELLTIVTMLALLQAITFSLLTGRARGKYGVKAPAVTGDPMFERYYRVQYNTIEQLILFLPGLWAFGYFIGQYWAVGIGVVYLAGRIIYAIQYLRDPDTRAFGTLLSTIPCWILVIGSLVGAIIQVASG